MRYRDKFLSVVLAALLGVLANGAVSANGWAHASIPFKALLAGLEAEDATTRERSAQFLGLRGRVEAVPPLIALLERGEEASQVRSATYTALGRLGDFAGVAVLDRCLSNEQRAELRADCVLALGGLPYTVWAIPSHQMSKPCFLGWMGLRHHDFRIRAVAARSLAVLGRPDSITALIKVLSDESAEVRWTAALGLGRLRAVTAVPSLVALLSDRNAKVREEASLSLGYIGDSRAREALTQLSKNDSDTRVRAAAALSLELLSGIDGTE